MLKSRQEIIGAVKSMNKRGRDDFLEELLATISPEYLESIKDARVDYKAGRVKTHDEVIGHGVTGLYIPREEILTASIPVSKSASARIT